MERLAIGPNAIQCQIEPFLLFWILQEDPFLTLGCEGEPPSLEAFGKGIMYIVSLIIQQMEASKGVAPKVFGERAPLSPDRRI